MPNPMTELFKTEATDALEKIITLPATEEILSAVNAIRGAAMLAGLNNAINLMNNWQEILSGFSGNNDLTQLLQNKAQDLLKMCGNEDESFAPETDLNSLYLTPSVSAQNCPAEKAAASVPTITAKEPPKKPGSIPATIEVDPFMLEMFNSEAEERLQALTSHIMGLENNPADSQCLENLMRAAHSLKGAARIIGLKPVAELSHHLEDYFVAAQKGEITICSDIADILLNTVDGLSHLCNLTESDPQPYIQNLSSIRSVNPCKANVLSPYPEQSADLNEKSTTEVTPANNNTIIADSNKSSNNATASTSANATNSQIVRVSAQSITCIMGLAGETVVQAQNMEPLAQTLHQLKNRLDRLLEGVRNIEAMFKGEENPAITLLEQLRQEILRCQNIAHTRIDEFDSVARNATDLSERLYNEVLSSRMRPFSEGVQGFYRMVRDLSRELGKRVKFQIIGKDTKVDRDVLDKLESPLTHLLRNAIDHGLQTPEERMSQRKTPENNLTVQALHWAGFLNVRVIDDGRGIDTESVRRKIVERGLHEADKINDLSEQEVLEFLFLPGFSTAQKISEISGRGVGLDIVRDMLRELGGNVTIDNKPDQGVTFHLRLPVTRSVARVLLIEIGGETYALPLNRIERLLKIAPTNILSLEGKPYICDDGKNIALIEGRRVFGYRPSEIMLKQPVVVVSCNEKLYGIKVDSFIGEKELVIRPLDERLGKVRNVSSVIALEDSRLALVIDIDDVITGIQSSTITKQQSMQPGDVSTTDKASVLIIDDSPTVREMERKILEAKGYYTECAVDGIDGWIKARNNRYDLIISDIDMPRMNGIELVKNLRATPEGREIPIMLVSYKDREEDRQAGLDAGANHFMNKGGFNDHEFLVTVKQLTNRKEA